MNGYIFDVYEGLTDQWHSGGSALVFAETLRKAKNALNRHVEKIEYRQDQLPDPLPEPRMVFEVVGVKPQVLIFDDSGCC